MNLSTVNETNQLKVILLGAGGRGRAYTDIMLDQLEKFKVVAVAEPISERREYIRKAHNIPENMCFESWEPIFELEKFADVVIIATMDQMHYAPCMCAIEKHYDILLEKPATPFMEECAEISKKAKENNVKILVCHVLRYNPFYRKLKDLIDDGVIGEVMSIHADECVGNAHQSHSFVRGNWGNSKDSAPMILAKCCHDMDVLQWLIDKPCKKVQSFGSLSYFTKENAPNDSTEYCYDGCPHLKDCVYSAENIYFGPNRLEWMRSRVANDMDADDNLLREVLKTSDYGKCVFKCNNDVVDHQVVNMEFEGGCTVSFTMCAFNKGGRHIRVMGTKGELCGDATTSQIELFDFKTRETTNVSPDYNIEGDGIDKGHGGGDPGIVNSLYDYVALDIKTKLLSEIEISAKNHMIAFAAEKSRLSGTVVEIDKLV